MSREYSIVRPRFWIGDTGKDIRKMGHQVQVVAFYLITCPTANMLGLYYLGMPTLCHETGSPFEGASKALRSLHEAKFAHYDSPSECVFVPNMAREQIGERLKRKDNRHVAVLRELHQLRKAPFFNDFLNLYREPFELQDIEFVANLRSPLEAPSKPLRSQDQDQDQNQDQSKSPIPPFDPSKISGLDVDAWNEWVEYRDVRRPKIKAVSKPKAAKAMAKLAGGQRAAVDYSIANGYQGLIEPKTNGKHGGPAQNDDAAWAEARSAAKEIGFRDPWPQESANSYLTAVKMQRDSPPRRSPVDVSKLTGQMRFGK